jgi:predicted dehydrogenase
MSVRLGFIGAGGIAHRHFGVLQQFEDVEIAAVSDVAFDRAREAAEQVGGKPFEDWRAMLDSEQLDALFICIPPFAHGEPEREAIARRLPFFVEKPVSLDIATAEAISVAIQRAGLITAVGYHWRYLEPLDEVRPILAENPARLVSGYWLDGTPPPAWWHRQDRSGGQMVEQTTHIIDLCRYLVGEPLSVYGLAGHWPRAEFPDLDVADVTTASLKFETGAIGNLASTCLLKWNQRVALHLFGDAMAIEITDHDVAIDRGRGRHQRAAVGDPVVQQDRDFIDAVEGRPNRIRCPYAEAVRTHRVALSVLESARLGEPIQLSTTLDAPMIAKAAHA